jgi:hypothetical protein
VKLGSKSVDVIEKSDHQNLNNKDLLDLVKENIEQNQ